MLEDATYTLLDSDNRVIGVGFRAPVLNAAYEGTFLLTAGHSVLAERRRTGTVRVVRSSSGDDHAGSILMPNGAERGPDVGLVHVAALLGGPLPLTGLITPGAVTVRGAPSGVVTEQASFAGRILGEEWHATDGRIVDVILEDLGWLEHPRRTSEPLVTDQAASVAYAALGGLSGAPVVQVQADGVGHVCAMIVSRNVAGIANRVYGVPISVAGRHLASRGFPIKLAHAAAYYEQSLSATALTGRLMHRILQSPGGAAQLWDEVSELFYMGIPVDLVLNDVLSNPQKYHLEGDLQTSQVEFLLGRLLLKRGKVSEARRHLGHVAHRSHRDASPEHLHLAALVNLRLVLEEGHEPNLRRRRDYFKDALGRYESTGPVSDNERAYEIASAVGREASLLPFVASLTQQDGGREYFSWLARQHRVLLESYPETLMDKQEVVQIALTVLSSLYGLNELRGSERIEHLEACVRRGATAAIQRENAIFFVQMILVSAVLSSARGELTVAFTLACYAGGTLRRAGLGLRHEGIGLIVRYLDVSDPTLANIVRSVFEYDVEDGIRRVISSSTGHAKEYLSALTESASRSTEWLEQTRNFRDVFDLILDDT